MSDSSNSLSLPALRAAGSGSHDIGTADDMSWQYPESDKAPGRSSDPEQSLPDGANGHLPGTKQGQWQYSGDPYEAIEAGDRASLLDEIRRRIYRPWFDEAACSGSDLDFTARSAKVIAECLQVCGRCPVREECREYADELEDVHAVLGGEDPAARKARWKVRGRLDGKGQ